MVASFCNSDRILRSILSNAIMPPRNQFQQKSDLAARGAEISAIIHGLTQYNCVEVLTANDQPLLTNRQPSPFPIRTTPRTLPHILAVNFHPPLTTRPL